MYSIFGYSPPPAAIPLPAVVSETANLPTPASTGLSVKLPPPPSDAERESELSVVKAAQSVRSAAGDAWATYMDEQGATTMWKGPARLMREHLGAARGWAATGAMTASMGASLVTPFLQTQYAEPRPFQMSKAIKMLVTKPVTSSYPSGHARIAYAAARAVQRLDPQQTDAVFELAQSASLSRVYAGAHLPSDIHAGANLGVGITDRIFDTAAKVARLLHR